IYPHAVALPATLPVGEAFAVIAIEESQGLLRVETGARIAVFKGIRMVRERGLGARFPSLLHMSPDGEYLTWFLHHAGGWPFLATTMSVESGELTELKGIPDAEHCWFSRDGRFLLTSTWE